MLLVAVVVVVVVVAVPYIFQFVCIRMENDDVLCFCMVEGG